MPNAHGEADAQSQKPMSLSTLDLRIVILYSGSAGLKKEGRQTLQTGPGRTRPVQLDESGPAADGRRADRADRLFSNTGGLMCLRL